MTINNDNKLKCENCNSISLLIYSDGIHVKYSCNNCKHVGNIIDLETHLKVRKV